MKNPNQSSLENQIINYYVNKILSIELKLNQSPDIPRKNEISNLVEKILTNDFKLKKEDVDILSEVSDTGIKIGEIDRNIAEKLGYVHQTANAFVISPKKKVIIQRRVPHKKAFPMHVTIYGGHLSANQTFEEGIERELIEELNLSTGKLDNELKFVEYSYYNQSNDPNIEKRGLFVYELSVPEYFAVMGEKEKLENGKMRMDEAQYQDWIKNKGNQAGYGEVWALYEIEFEELINAESEQKIYDGIGNIRVRFIELQDVFKGNKIVNEKAFFTPDLLNLILEDEELIKKIKEKI